MVDGWRGACVSNGRYSKIHIFLAEWWHSGLYIGLPITRSVGQFPLRTLMYTLSSSYIEI